MLFNSVSFLIFFPITTAIYFALPHRARWAFLLVASALFYMAFVPAYILILLFTIAVDYLAGLLIEKSPNPWRRLLLASSIVANVGVLALFKYFAFANDNIAWFAHAMHWAYPAADVFAGFVDRLRAFANLLRGDYPIRSLGILLPLGLSFHTFQAMSYTIEVYLGRQKAERHLGIYALYVLFYPQLVAGPIERPQHLLHQFRRHVRFNPDRTAEGLRRMLWGFFKKLVIADRMAPIVDVVYNHPTHYGAWHLLLATYLFAVQIYCDFSGYTDIALGTAKVLGIRLMENFDRPYAARSIGEFWRRWHISLSTWFRDYLYIPLGGNRVRLPRWCVNVLIVFVVSGLWHGASWTFALWGLLHGIYLVFSRLGRPLRERAARLFRLEGPSPLRHAIQVFVTFQLVALGWIFFRANSVSDAFLIVKRIALGLVGLGQRSIAKPYATLDLQIAVALIVLLEVVQWVQKQPRGRRWFASLPPWQRWPTYYALVLLIFGIGELGARSFIYFQF